MVRRQHRRPVEQCQRPLRVVQQIVEQAALLVRQAQQLVDRRQTVLRTGSAEAQEPGGLPVRDGPALERAYRGARPGDAMRNRQLAQQ